YMYWHEWCHLQHYREVGRQAFARLSETEMETEAFRRLYRNYWSLLNAEEQQHAINYAAYRGVEVAKIMVSR
ncbi:MAG: hypothetical protein N3A38_17200, partial [Planctomycetota bacterium]|nr:hypothetical protein [Planctomycetota bacterium]